MNFIKRFFVIFVKFSSNFHQIFIKFSIKCSSNFHQIFIKFSSNFHQIFLKFSSIFHQFFIKFSSNFAKTLSTDFIKSRQKIFIETFFDEFNLEFDEMRRHFTLSADYPINTHHAYQHSHEFRETIPINILPALGCIYTGNILW
jgi:hypothetical protein